MGNGPALLEVAWQRLDDERGEKSGTCGRSAGILISVSLPFGAAHE
jgi:hypothetical protein